MLLEYYMNRATFYLQKLLEYDYPRKVYAILYLGVIKKIKKINKNITLPHETLSLRELAKLAIWRASSEVDFEYLNTLLED